MALSSLRKADLENSWFIAVSLSVSMCTTNVWHFASYQTVVVAVAPMFDKT